MRTLSVAVLTVVLSIATGCQMAARTVKPPPLDADSEVWVYLSALPAQADRLAFSLESVAASRSDGQEFPLTVVLADLSGKGNDRQRLLASGRIPPGDYGGLNVRVRKATLAGPDGAPASLLVPNEPVKVPVPFQVSRARARVLSLSFQYAPSIDQGFGFRPVFTGGVPPLPIVEMLGFATDTGSDAVTVFDRRTRQVAAVLPTGRDPGGMVVDTAQNRLLVALQGADEVASYDLVSGAELGRARLQPGDRPQEIALGGDGRTLVVTCPGSNSVAFVDSLALAEVGRARAGMQPTVLVMDRSGRRAYAFNQGSSSATIVDVVARAAAGTFPTDGAVARGAFNRNGDRLYLVSPSSAYMTVLAIPSLGSANKVYVGYNALSVHVDPRTDYAYVSMGDVGQLQAFAPMAPIPVGRIDLPGPATWLSIDDAYDVLLGVVPSLRGVTGMELTSRRVLPMLDTGAEPYAAAVVGERR